MPDTTHTSRATSWTSERGEFLDQRIMRAIQKEYPSKEAVLSVADRLVRELRDAVLTELPTAETIVYNLCLLEIAVSIVSPREDFDMDFHIREGREYVGPRHRPKQKPQEIPYRQAIEVLAAMHRACVF